MKERIAIAPAYKGITDFDDDTLEVLRDTQEVSSDNISGNTLSFFPRSTSGQTEAEANYTKNPLPGDRPYDIVGIGFEFTHHLLEDLGSSSTISLEAFANELFNGVAILKTDQRREELINKHLVELLQLDTADYYEQGDAPNQDYDNTLVLPSNGLLRIDDPIHISTQEVFELDVTFGSTTNFPSAANYTSLAQGGALGMIAKLQVAYNE